MPEKFENGPCGCCGEPRGCGGCMMTWVSATAAYCCQAHIVPTHFDSFSQQQSLLPLHCYLPSCRRHWWRQRNYPVYWNTSRFRLMHVLPHGWQGGQEAWHWSRNADALLLHLLWSVHMLLMCRHQWGQIVQGCTRIAWSESDWALSTVLWRERGLDCFLPTTNSSLGF